MNNKIKTKPIKKLCIFALIGLLLSIAVIIAFIFMDDPIMFRAIVWIFSGVFVIISLIILRTQLLHFTVLDGDKLIRYRSIFKTTINVIDIEKIVNKDGLFDVIVNGKRFVTLSSDDENVKLILISLEKQGLEVKR